MSAHRDGPAPPLSNVRLLEALSEAQSRYIAEAAPADFFDRLLRDVIDLTASEYGFIAEAMRDPHGAPYIKTRAVTNIAWDDTTRRFYDENVARGLEFRNLRTLFGHALLTGAPVVSNDPANDPRRGGLPAGHPAMTAFLGLPVHLAGEMVGMIGLANRPGGYDDAVVEFLRPFLSTVAAAIASHRLSRARTAADEALRESETRHRAILETALDAILTIDESGVVESCNRAAEEMFRIPRDEIVGRNVSRLMPEPWSTEHDRYLRRYVDGGEPRVLGSTREVVARRADGTEFPASLALAEARLPSGRRFVGVLRDVSQRRASEDALLDASSRLSALIEAMPAAVLLETEDRRIALVNQRFCDLFRVPVPPTALLGADCAGAAARAAPLFTDPVRFESRIGEILAAREPVRSETLRMADGRVVERDFVPLWTAGEYSGHFWQYRDVSDRARAEEALRISDARKSAILESALDAVISIDRDGRVIDFNPAAERMFGRTRAESLGRDLSGLIIPERHRRGHAEGMSRFLETGEGPVLGRLLELPALRRDGTEFPVEVSISTIHVEGQRVFTAHLRDITERKNAENALHDARDAAERASRFKSDFLASMSHEIRTPMTAIVGYADMLLRPHLSPADRDDAVRHVRKNADYLLGLLNDILDLSKIEAGRMTVHLERTSVTAVLAAVVSLLRPRASEKGIALDVEFAGPVPASVRTDPLRLRQVLMNLVSNAVKFTDEGRVLVRVAFHAPPAPGGPGSLRFDVRDTGIGIDPEHMPRLFAAFTQFHGAAPRRTGGTGLGLAISKRLAEALGGGVSAQSEPGRGSTFTFAVPVAPEDCATLDAEPDLARHASPEESAAPVRLDGLRLLVVDDNPDNLRIERYILEDAGAQVETADNGRRGADAVFAAARAGRPFDAVLMDMQMPVLDGYSATGEIRRAGIRTPVIAVTAHAMSDDAQRCLSAGCDAYLSKPIVPQAMLATVESLVARRTDAPPPKPVPLPRRRQRPAPFDDPDFLDLVREYASQFPTHVRDLHEALTARAWDRLRVQTHRLRGTGTSFGFPQITAAAAAAEDAIRAGAPEADVVAAVEALAAVLGSAKFSES